MRNGLPPLVLIAAVVLGCGDAEASRDFGSDDQPDHARSYLALGPEVLRLGGPDAQGGYLFSQISGGALDDAGRLWLADGASREVRAFGPGGEHLLTSGGGGDGPGEFRSVQLLGIQNDLVVIGDAGNRRLTYFDLEGALQGTAQIEGGAGSPRFLGLLSDGSLFGTSAVYLNASEVIPGQILGDSARVVVWSDLATEPRIVGRAPSASFVWDGQGMTAVPFTANIGTVAQGADVHVTSGTQFRIRVLFENGEASYGVNRAPSATSAFREEYREFYSRNLSGAELQEFLDMLESEVVPDFAPAYSRLMRRSNGETWARHYSVDPLAAGEWDVYSANHLYLGRVRTPDMFRILAIGEHEIWGISFDDYYVEYLSKYEIGR